MKPRLRMSCPLTPEDFAIWDRISDPPPPEEPVSLFGYQESDRRDADLMLQAAEDKAISVTTSENGILTHSVWWEFGQMSWYCAKCGCSRETTLHIMYCA